MPYVYILTNLAMPDMIKIGKTSTSVEQRMSELNRHSGVPLPFTCFYAAEVADADLVEKKLHHAFGDHRVRPQREFFYLSPSRAQSVLELVAITDATPREEIFDDNPLEAEEAIEKSLRRKLPTFDEYGIPQGSTLTFQKDQSIVAVVDGARTVNFNNESTSMTAAALLALKQLGYSWKSVQGPAYWEFEGETVLDRFHRMREQ
jgi:hypothetical protein